MKTHTAAFLEALMWAYHTPEELEDFTIHDFHPEFIAGAEAFMDGFERYLEDTGTDNPCTPEQLGHGAYLSLSGAGAGFWDTDSTEHLQPVLEVYAGGKYRFEDVDLSPDEAGKLDLSFLPEYVAEYRAKLFTVPVPGITWEIAPDRSTLTLRADQKTRLLIAAMRDDLADTVRTEDEWIEPVVCNSELGYVSAGETGDLTDAPMLGIRDEGGKVLERWGWMDYAVESWVDRLARTGECVWIGGATGPWAERPTPPPAPHHGESPRILRVSAGHAHS